MRRWQMLSQFGCPWWKARPMFHQPCKLCCCFFNLCQSHIVHCASPCYTGMEATSRDNCAGTVWGPGLAHTCPCLLQAADLCAQLRRTFLAVLPDPPPMAESEHVALAVIKLQVYKADRFLRGLQCKDLGPEWRQQKASGESAAALGNQRGSKLHKHALPSFVPEGLDKNMHWKAASCLLSPF